MKILLILAMMALLACSSNLNSSSQQTNRQQENPNDGNEQGNGTDNPPAEESTAWFYGNEPIKYCVDIAPDFPVSEQKIRDELKIAFAMWKEYIHAKDVNGQMKSNFISSSIDNFPEPTRSELEKLAEAYSSYYVLATNSKLLNSCNGQEDVKFYFGSKTSEVDNALKNYYDPTAISKRTTFNSTTGWSKGFVWLATHLKDRGHAFVDWTLPYRLRGILTHEIGHIYGVGHVEGTIMRENMTIGFGSPNWTTQPQSEVEYILTHIDNERELVIAPATKKDFNFKGITSLSMNVERIFSVFGNRKPVGPVTSEYKNGVLEFKDTLGSLKIPINIEPSSLITKVTHHIFKTYRTWWNSPHNAFPDGSSCGINSEEQFLNATTKDMNGNDLLLQITRNTGSTPLVIFYIYQHQRHILFMAESPFAY